MKRVAMYSVRFYPYCGMVVPVAIGVSLEDARANVRAWICYHRKKLGYPVTRLGPGEWELESDPEGRCMIGDHEGYLRVTKHKG